MESSEGYQPPQINETQPTEKWSDMAIRTVTKAILPTTAKLIEIYGEEMPPKNALKNAMALDATRGATRLASLAGLFLFPETAVGSALVASSAEIIGQKLSTDFIKEQNRSYNKAWSESHIQKMNIRQSE